MKILKRKQIDVCFVFKWAVVQLHHYERSWLLSLLTATLQQWVHSQAYSEPRFQSVDYYSEQVHSRHV